MSEPITDFSEPRDHDPFCSTLISRKIFDTASWCYNSGKMALIVGEPGIGKTTALERFGLDRDGIIMVTMSPARNSMRGALSYICHVLCNYTSHDLGEIHGDLVIALASKRLLIIDEAHQLNDRIIDELRCIHDESGVAILLCGNASFRSRFNKEQRAFGQVTSRVSVIMNLQRPSEEDIGAICDYYEVRDLHARKFLYRQSESMGGLRVVNNLITMATKLAEHGAAIRLEHLETALLILGGAQ